MIYTNIYLNAAGSDYLADMVKIDREDIRRADMRIIAPIERRNNIIAAYSQMLGDGQELVDNSGVISFVGFLRSYLPMIDSDCCDINIPAPELMYFIKDEHGTIYDIHLDIIIKYVLGTTMFCDAVICHLERSLVMCPNCSLDRCAKEMLNIMREQLSPDDEDSLLTKIDTDKKGNNKEDDDELY